MFPAFGLSVYERDKMADYSSAWRVITRIVTDYFFYHELFFCHTESHGESFYPELSNYRIFLHTENHGRSRRISLSRICEFANCSSHGELRMVTENLSIPNLRICELFFTRRIADVHGGFICHELANCSSHGWLRTVTEDFYGMRPLLWTY